MFVAGILAAEIAKEPAVPSADVAPRIEDRGVFFIYISQHAFGCLPPSLEGGERGELTISCLRHLSVP